MEEKDIEDYIGKIENKELSENQKEILIRSISHEEIQDAINTTKLRKAPELDGYTAKFYRRFKEELIAYLHIVFNQIMEGGEAPKTWHQAVITIIPKDESVCPNVRNFRPISLLNVDYKIFTKILAGRLKIVLNEIIGKDQTGFLLGQHLRDNVRRTVLDMIEYGEKNTKTEIGTLLFGC